MSDGESAAPWARLSESAFPDGVDRWITVPPATWVAAQGPRDTQNVGCHATGAVSVADLIARLGPAFPDLPTHRHVAPEPEPSGRGPKVHDDADDQQTPRLSPSRPTRSSSSRSFPTSGQPTIRAPTTPAVNPSYPASS